MTAAETSCPLISHRDDRHFRDPNVYVSTTSFRCESEIRKGKTIISSKSTTSDTLKCKSNRRPRCSSLTRVVTKPTSVVPAKDDDEAVTSEQSDTTEGTVEASKPTHAVMMDQIYAAYWSM